MSRSILQNPELTSTFLCEAGDQTLCITSFLDMSPYQKMAIKER
jgi:hypothetical protein